MKLLKGRTRNLFPVNHFSGISGAPTNPTTVNYAIQQVCDTLQFKPNTRYTLQLDLSETSDATKTPITFSFKYSDATSNTIFVNNTKHYILTSSVGKSVVQILISYGYGNIQISLDNVQLEEGSTATPYIPYKALLKSGGYLVGIETE